VENDDDEKGDEFRADGESETDDDTAAMSAVKNHTKLEHSDCNELRGGFRLRRERVDRGGVAPLEIP
jgi:TATA-binding protein-associated factor Taf7